MFKKTFVISVGKSNYHMPIWEKQNHKIHKKKYRTLSPFFSEVIDCRSPTFLQKDSIAGVFLYVL